MFFPTASRPAVTIWLICRWPRFIISLTWTRDCHTVPFAASIPSRHLLAIHFRVSLPDFGARTMLRTAPIAIPATKYSYAFMCHPFATHVRRHPLLYIHCYSGLVLWAGASILAVVLFRRYTVIHVEYPKANTWIISCWDAQCVRQSRASLSSAS
jgi:hypothetical protein